MAGTVTDERDWERLTDLFDRLLAGEPEAEVLASEPDPELRRRASELWRHHMSASAGDFLKQGIDVKVPPVFEPGQTLLNRFEIQRMLGRGGMGEVYLAYDRKVEEDVALKTVARLLAPSPSIRRRIVAEVQNARRVTHPNICRIHELFDEGETLFFTMQYLEGRTLADFLLQKPAPGGALTIARQLAEGLHAAHENGVIHGDFKPANVMVVSEKPLRAVIMDFGLARAVERPGAAKERVLSVHAGTAEYMAPELKDGAPPTVRSDIYAFGKVAQELAPRLRIWEQCTRHRPEERPASLEPVLRALAPKTTRRAWIVGGALVCGAAASYPLWRQRQIPIYLPENARLVVNAFRAAAAQFAAARVARALLVTALRQSPKIRTIADEDFLGVARRLKTSYPAPVAGADLEKILAQLRAAFWVDADLEQKGGRYSLHLNLLRSEDRRVLAAHSFRDLPAVAALAQEAALWLRNSAGESQTSLEANPVNAASFTSRVPEALQKYYDAMEFYAVGNMEQAAPLLREALRLDPGFAQAHSMLSAVVRSPGNYEEAYHEAELALNLSGHLPERERAIIEARFSRMTDDPVAMVETARRELAYYPDEPRAYDNLAVVLSRDGAPEDAIPLNRRAMELSPGGELRKYYLIYNLCAAGDFAEGLREFESDPNASVRNAAINENGGIAYMGLERYDDALAVLEKEPAGNHRLLDLQRVRILQGDLEGAIAAVQELKTPNELERHRGHEYLCGLYYVTGRAEQAKHELTAMLDLPPYPLHARRQECTAFWALRLSDGDVLAKTHEQLQKIAARWPNGLTKAVQTHAEALRAWRRNALDDAGQLLLRASSLASTIWITYDLAELYALKGEPDVAENYWRQIETHRAMILSYWFTGTIVLGWLSRAMAASARKDREAARTYAKKVLDHWGPRNPGIPAVQVARNILTLNSN
jgi:tetratricopeptide (TPR) repeat protein